jgi:putative transposase
MAVWRRKPSAGLVHHSDRGAQYTALSFGKKPEEAGIIPSMGRAGLALDNAISESFCPPSNASSSSGVASLPTRDTVRNAVFEYLEAFYNRRRLHSSLGYMSPKGYEETLREGAAVA